MKNTMRELKPALPDQPFLRLTAEEFERMKREQIEALKAWALTQK